MRTNSAQSNGLLTGSSSDVTVRHILNSYIGYAKANLSTRRELERVAKLYYSTICDKEATSLTLKDLQSLQTELSAKFTPKTTNRIVALLGAAYNHSIRLNVIPNYNPVQALTRLQVDDRCRMLNPEELMRFFQALSLLRNELIRDFILVCMFTSELRSYVIQMQWDTIDLDRGLWFIQQRKGKPRTVFLLPEVVEILKQRKRQSNNQWVFSTKSKSGHLEVTDKSWYKLLKLSGIYDFRLNDLRNTKLNPEPARNAMTLYYDPPECNTSVGRLTARQFAAQQAVERKAKKKWRESVNDAVSKPVIRPAIPPPLILSPFSEDFSSPLFGQLFDYYMQHHGNKSKTAKTIKGYFRRWFKCFADRPVGEITTSDVLQWHCYIGENASNTTANRALEILRAVYNRAIRWQLIDMRNPGLPVDRFKTQSRDRFLSREENARLEEALDNYENTTFRAFVQVLRFTAARAANVESMQWQDIDFETNAWRIPMTKNGKPHVIPLLPQVLEALELQRGKDPVWVFPGHSRGKSGHIINPYRHWKRLIDIAGLTDLRRHDLRRTMGSWQAKTGASLPIISKTLGHSNPSATQIYARLDIEPVREAMKIASQAFQGSAKSADQLSKTAGMDTEQLAAVAEMFAAAVAERLQQSEKTQQSEDDQDVLKIDDYREKFRQ